MESFFQLEEAWKYMIILPMVGAGVIVGAEWLKYAWYGDQAQSNIRITTPYGLFCIAMSLPVIIPTVAAGGVYMNLAPYQTISIGAATLSTVPRPTNDEEGATD